MTDKFTPGPWRFYTEPQPNGCPIVGNGKGMMVAMLAHSVNYKDQREEALANAALIAAAPALLQAAVAALELLKVIHDETGKVGMQLQAAIAKARGL